MTITVKTESGSIYEFTQKDGKTFFRKGIRLSGEVIRIKNAPICVGKEIRMDIFKDGLYGNIEKELMICNTTPVEEISVIL